MEDQVTQILLDLAKQNAQHINVLNSEMGGVQAELGIIKWFLMVNVVAWIGIFAGQFRNILKSSK